jgi:urease accessory protein
LSSLISRPEPAPSTWSTGLKKICSSPLERVGRDGLLDLAFVRRGEQTILARRRFTHPLHALNPARADDGSLYLTMLNNSGGMVGGDRLLTTVELGPNAATALITASASKAYRTVGAPAIAETIIRTGRGATLEYLPDHLIPHPGAIVHQSLRVDMESGSRAIVYDAIAAGRIGRGERWAFGELRTETILTRGAKPLYINRARIIPALQPLAQLGWAQDFNYFATMVIVGAAGADGSTYEWAVLSSAIESALRDWTGVHGACSELGCGGSVVRFMAYNASDLTSVVQRLWSVARRFLLGREAFEWRKF